MSSSLERLKAAAAKAPAAPTTSAPAASTPAPSAPAAPVTPAATAPAPTPPAATAPAPQPSTPASNAPAVSTPAASAPALVVPVSVETDDEARKMLALLHGTVDGDDGASPADVFDELDNAGGLAFSHPFAQVRKGNWDVHKSCPTSIVDFMPAGKRAFNMIYLGYRIGAIGWPCTGGATPGGAPPLYKFAIPHRRMFPQSTEMTRQTLLYGSKIQYKRVNEEKYKHLGKLTPETHIFGWTPDIGFMVLSVQGFSPSELTTGGLSAKTARDMEGQGPLCFTIEAEVTINNKVPVDAKNHKWTDYWIKGEFMPTEAKSTALYEAWEKMKATSIKEVANQTIMFHKALDYKGLSAEEISKKLAQYAAAIG